jgi:hypothetical protein
MYTAIKMKSTPNITGNRSVALSENSNNTKTAADINADIREMFTAICLGEEVLITDD